MPNIAKPMLSTDALILGIFPPYQSMGGVGMVPTMTLPGVIGMLTHRVGLFYA